ncbi:MAG: hypothetical protein ACI9G1_005450, partial [Pirellulaceae bacterium]
QGGLNRRYLRVQDLQRLQHAKFTGRRIVEGMYAGRHASAQRGQSVEFRDYREYMPGDEMNAVDWKVYARSDRLFIKLFENQVEMTVHLLVDGSASMAYRGHRSKDKLSKFDQACHLAAAIAFLVTKQNDRVSVSYAKEGLFGFRRASNSMRDLLALLHEMETVRLAGQSQIGTALKDLVGNCGRRDLFVIFSDLLEDREELLKSISICRSRGGEVIVFHVLHDDEVTLPTVDNGLFIDSENGNRIRLNIRDVREEYEKRIQEFLAGWDLACKGHGVDYNRVLTSDHYYEVLERYMFRRAARRV